MRLNKLAGADRSRDLKKRVGRGTGSGCGKTCGRGHKGQRSRSGGYSKVGFEGGQMPLQRRLPKIGFRSRKASAKAEVRLGELGSVEEATVDLATLKRLGLVPNRVARVKIVLSGALTRPLTISGVGVTRGARAAIQAAGGKVEGVAEA